jgi:hypothetical protein
MYPTSKPVELIECALLNNSKFGDLVVDSAELRILESGRMRILGKALEGGV